MKELIAAVVAKTNLPEAQAKLAVETVVGFLKTKLPAPIAGQLDAAISGSSAGAAASAASAAKGALGELLGK